MRSLALHGACVVMACRNLESATECKQKIKTERSAAKVEVMKLDLASLTSVKEFADAYKEKDWYATLKHFLVCVAGFTCSCYWFVFWLT